jgi:hypothetical protein
MQKNTLETSDINKKRDNVKIKKTENITTIYVEFLKFLIKWQTIIKINSIYKKVINHEHIWLEKYLSDFWTCSRISFPFNIWSRNSAHDKFFKYFFTMIKAFTVSILSLLFPSVQIAFLNENTGGYLGKAGLLKLTRDIRIKKGTVPGNMGWMGTLC